FLMCTNISYLPSLFVKICERHEDTYKVLRVRLSVPVLSEAYVSSRARALSHAYALSHAHDHTHACTYSRICTH
ncbi:MAG: hypothetical protein ACK55Z_03060, partial [bacterium]